MAKFKTRKERAIGGEDLGPTPPASPAYKLHQGIRGREATTEARPGTAAREMGGSHAAYLAAAPRAVKRKSPWSSQRALRARR